MKTRKLSINQELKLLRLLKNAEVLSYGSSRWTFVHPLDKTKVVKLAVGKNALCQNKLEVNTWLKYGDSLPLARIYEYGRFIEVMERMDEIYDDEYYDYAEDDDARDQMDSISCKLDSVLGETPDNYQIGVVNGEWKSYDYGFDPYRGAMKMCGFASDFGSKSIKQEYIPMVEKLLRRKQPANQIDRLAHGRDA